MVSKRKKKRSVVILAYVFVCGLFICIETSSHNYMEKVGEFTGVVDRFENNQAVILLEDVGEEMIVSKNLFPSGIEANMWLRFEVYDEPKQLNSMNR
ncbi:DUF3006 domain-containing protein [Oceanobacillus polygoni]|uniref:Uncharacterized protein n=1 Tax=Oceanobacillus polygoni TaxID=1235259 RepID=A0A9X0YU08_9BACI|nr:DUF3006 domain-containing protein [Oceanobacillus polygoni]MBP2077144.1 hypothetical protein [Oceanobacillus polygoni]